MALFERRAAGGLPHSTIERPPAIDRRRRGAAADQVVIVGDGFEEPPEPDEEEKMRLIENLAAKFLRKVAAERAARLNGEIVAADFYLRQVTVLETIFDLTNHAFGWDASAVIRKLRRGRFDLNQIVDTPFADLLDQSRRAWWAAEGDPERPSHPDPHFLLRHDTEDGACTTYADQHSTGATTTPARGHSAEQWAAMNEQEQRAARQAQFAEDAAEQKKWEARAIAEHRAQSRSDP